MTAADGDISRRSDIESLLGAALVVGFAIYTWPALTIARQTISPSVLGVDAVRQHLNPRTSDLYVAFPMSPFIDTFLPYYPYRQVFDERGLPMSTPARKAWFLTEIDHTEPAGYVFRRERGAIWNIARRHYFDVALEPMTQSAQFVSGWYLPERNGVEEWRWMTGRSITLLPRKSRPTKLRLQFDVPDELMPLHPTVSFLLNGIVIDRFRPPDAHLVREYDVKPASSTNTLEMTIDRTLKSPGPHSDAREMGLMLRFLSWGPE